MSAHLSFFTSAATFDSTYFTDDADGTIRRSGSSGEGALHTGKSITFLPFDPSPSGYLMYLEKTKDSKEYGLGFYYELTQEQKKRFIESRKHDYDPDTITLILHVCDANLKDIAVVPIPIRHGAYWNEGRFQGDGLVILEQNPRWGGTLYRTVVNLKTKEVFSFKGIETRKEGQMLGEIALSPDGSNFVMEARSRELKKSVLYLNGQIIYPAWLTEFPLPSDSPEEYKTRSEKLKAAAASVPRRHAYSELTDSAWLPDGCCIAFVEGTSEGTKIRTVDVRKLKAVKDLDRASITQPISITTGENYDSPTLQFTDGKIDIIKHAYDSLATDTLPTTIHLPRDWKEQIEKK